MDIKPPPGKTLDGRLVHTTLLQAAPESMFYAVLPKAIRSRIPVLTSLRRTASTTMFRRPTKRRSPSADGLRDDAQSTGTISLSSTPRSGSPESLELVQSSRQTESALEPAHLQCGVNWEIATHGCRTWLSARSMAQQTSADPAQIRALHIDAVRYMAMSLPKDLTPQEAAILRQDIPVNVLRPPDFMEQRPRGNSLRSGIAQVTCWIMAVVFFLLPLLMTGVNKALVFERQHQITEQVLSQSLDLGTLLSERGARLQHSFQRFSGGVVGGAFVNGGSWLAEGIAGGVIDGVRSSRDAARGTRGPEQ